MWASYLPRPDLSADLHDSADAYTVGVMPSPTGYATSADSLDWSGTALPSWAEHRWGKYYAGITSVLLDGPVPVAYYDGGATVEENYEECTGIAFGTGLGPFVGAGKAPVSISPHASGRLRYVAALRTSEGYRLDYVAAR